MSPVTRSATCKRQRRWRARYVEYGPENTGSAAGDDPLAAWRAARADMMAALGPAELARLLPGPGGVHLSLVT